MIVVFFAAGCLEIISILFRPVSLSFDSTATSCRGKYAGDHVPDDPRSRVAVADSVLFHEVLVGLVQAMVFMLLCAVFTLLICQHEEVGPTSGHGEDVSAA